MIPLIWRHWTNRIGIVGACLIFVGCGGSDIPDPGADSTPTAGTTVPQQPAPPEQVAAAEPKAAEPAAPAAQPAVNLAAVPPKPADSAAQPAGENPGTEPVATPEAQLKSDDGATAAEMLALSAGTSPAAPTAATTTPGAQGAPGGPQFGTPPAAPAFGGGAKPAFGNSFNGAGNNRDRNEEFGNFGGGKSRYGGAGGAPRDSKPVNYHDPRASVKAFLEALKDKDVDRLSEATALRSPYESSSKHRELFQRIVDGSISEAQLNDLAENLDEYKISGEAAVTSTGKLGILVSKKTKTGKMQRKITVRKEKAGWKVLDISSIIEFKGFRRYTPPKRPSAPTNN
jgi:hypothetical protein